MSTPTEPTTPRPARVPLDFEAILSAMQDQIDDLTAIAEAHARRLDDLDQKR